MKQQKHYIFLQKQILLMMGLSLIPGLVYVVFGWIFNVIFPALIWYGILIVISWYGWKLYQEFASNKMDEVHLARWYKKLTWFMYVIFSSWTVIFILYVGYDEDHLHYIAIFTQLGASVVASALLISDRKLFVPILFLLMLPLTLYFTLIGLWYGYVLALFSMVFLAILLYASSNTNKLLEDNYFQAQHDALTGLFNRRYFTEYMESLNERLLENDKTASICLIDLDHFKMINDSLGHDIGDKLLIDVSKRIELYVKNTHVLARLGGDEFILVSKRLSNKEADVYEGYAFAETLLNVMREPYVIEGHTLHITVSIGVYQLDPRSLFATNFIKEVDIAMYEAKSQGRDGVVVFNKDIEEKVERHLDIEQKLHIALKEHKLKVYYQPQFDLDEILVGCESLLRWHDDDLGVVNPNEFIVIAEKTGLILDIGNYVLKETFKTINSWNKKGKILKSFSINVSIRQLLHEPFVEKVAYLLMTYLPNKEPKQKIYFEITEHVFAEDINKVVAIMNRLKEMGISFSIDDFGTGYSSLSYLKILPIDEVKIDKSFIGDLSESRNNQKMIRAIIGIAKNFDLTIVAEGVETFEQITFLNMIDCDVYQGFYFDKALSKDIFEKKYIL
ncbi:MAG: bifunctional diguanylate cyclase/phosphodiesterase [Sulfurovum sp.]|nr:bifunctional diguanylate cyclase/phosphodiesterase [Sulfurovum sp.]